MKYIGIDIGGTDIKYGLFDALGNSVELHKVATPKTKKELLLELKKICEMYKTAKGLGVSCPGMISDEGVLITAGALFECYGMNMKEELSKFYNGIISIENDVNCAAMAELFTGTGKEHKNFITVAVGTGIGGALVVNGKLYKGSRFMAGEFGFMKMNPHVTNDPNHTMLSRNGSIYGGIIWMYEEKTGEVCEGKEIFDRAITGDEIAKQCVSEFYACLSTAIFNLIVSFDPEVVLIGGAISRRDGFIKTVNEKIKEIQKEYGDHLDIELAEVRACTHFNDSGMIGAVANVIAFEKNV